MNKITRVARQNAGVLSIALLVFLWNQFFELIILVSNEQPYARLCDWDCGWYGSIVYNGYDLEPHAHERGDAANWAFFPAFPLVASILARLGPWTTEFALVVVAKVFFFLSIFAFVKFATLYAPRVSPWVAGAVAGLHPYAIYGNVGYTESMFLFFSCLSFIALKQQKFEAAGLAGAVLSAVRPTGVLFGLAYLIAVFRRVPTAGPLERLRMGFGLLLVPLGLALFMVFLYYRMGDGLAFSHVQIAWERVPSNPFKYLVVGMQASDPLPQLWAWMTVFALVMIAYLVLTKEYGLAVFSLCATLIPLSTGLVAMPRYLWWQAPLLLVVAKFLSVTLLSIKGMTGSVASAEALAPRWWYRLPLAVLAIPVSVWGLAAMYKAWLLREALVV